MPRIERLLTLLAVLLLNPGLAGAAEAPDKDKVLATVNGNALTAEMLAVYTERRLADGSARRDDTGRIPNLLNDLVALEVMAQQAEKQGLQNDHALQVVLDLTRKNLLAQNLMQGYLRDNPVTEAELREAYELIKSRVYGAQYHVFHIQVGEEAKARELIERLKGGADFGELAKAESQDPTAENGGEIGWFGLGQLPGEFAAVIEKAKPDSLVDEPVKSSFGWHVIRLAAIREQPAPSFEESRDKLADLVNNQRLQSYVSKLRSEAKIGTPQ